MIAAQNFCSERVAPIFRVSSVTGEGLDNLKTFFNLLQPRIPTGKINDRAEFTVDDVFSVPGVGTVVSGTLVSGKVKAGDTMLMGPDSMGKFEQVHIKSIHRKRLPVQEVVAGQAAAFALKKIKKNQVRTNSMTRVNLALRDLLYPCDLRAQTFNAEWLTAYIGYFRSEREQLLLVLGERCRKLFGNSEEKLLFYIIQRR